MTERIVFKDSADSAIGKICMQKFWLLRAWRKGNVEKQVPDELEYASDGTFDDVRLVYVEDSISECCYAIVSGADAEAAKTLIRRKIPYWTPEEMFEAWKSAPHDTAQILAILRIGVGAPATYEESFACYFREALAHADESIREAALAALGYQDWPEFDDELKHIAECDSSERCRNRAAYMLEVSKEERGKQT
jgi:hypothetical protein